MAVLLVCLIYWTCKEEKKWKRRKEKIKAEKIANTLHFELLPEEKSKFSVLGKSEDACVYARLLPKKPEPK